MSTPNVNVRNRTSGSQLIADTNAASGDWVSIDVVTAAKFHTLTGNAADVANETEASATEIPAGTTIDGAFSAIQLHSGAVIAYKR